MLGRKKKLPVLSSKQKEGLKDPIKAVLLYASVPVVKRMKSKANNRLIGGK